MELVDAYTEERAHKVLYDLLRERQPHESISHKRMPTWAEHCRFVDSRPYQFWYLIRDEGFFVGAIYLTERLSEIGVWIFHNYARNSLAGRAIDAIIERHPRPRFIANINPQNKTWAIIFGSKGFRHIQNTYELVPE